MREKKPPTVSWESWVEAKIRDSIERGEFDDLPGAGKPLPDIDEPADDMRWVPAEHEAQHFIECLLLFGG